MNFRQSPVPALITALLISTSPAYATLVDIGAVSPQNSALQANYNSSMIIGYYGNSGTFEVNTSSIGNGLTAASNTGLMVGSTGSTGTVRVIGDGNSGSARIDINPGMGLRTGNGGTGNVEIRDGGVISSNEQDVYLGTQGYSSSTPGTSTVVVDGDGSILRTQQSSTGEWWSRDGGRIYVGFDGQSDSTVNISNGGLMEARSGQVGDRGDDGSIWIGTAQDTGSTATVNVSGDGSMMIADTWLEVGSRQSGNSSSLNVTDGGTVFGEQTYISTLDGDAEVRVSGLNSRLDSSDIQIGGTRTIAGFTASGAPVNSTSIDWSSVISGQQVQDVNGNPVFDTSGNPVKAVLHPTYGMLVPETYIDGNKIHAKNTGILIVEADAIVSAQTINISTNQVGAQTYNNQGATLTVRDGATVIADVNVFEDGILNGGQGSIIGNVVVDGGTVAPGNSPGVMNIDGNLELISGILELEVTEYLMDSFIISGDLIIGENTLIDIIFDFEPTNYILNLEDFFQVTGNFFIDQNFNLFDNISISGLSGEPSFAMNFNGEQRVFGAASVPEPSTIILLSFGLAGLGLSRRKRQLVA